MESESVAITEQGLQITPIVINESIFCFMGVIYISCLHKTFHNAILFDSYQGPAFEQYDFLSSHI